MQIILIVPSMFECENISFQKLVNSPQGNFINIKKNELN